MSISADGGDDQPQPKICHLFKVSILREFGRPFQEAVVYIKSNRLASEYEVRVVYNSRDYEVFVAPTMPLALEAKTLCEKLFLTTNDDATIPERAWTLLLEKCNKEPALSDADACGRRQSACQQKIVNSFLSEPFVQLGYVSCKRSAVKAVEVSVSKASAFVYVTLDGDNIPHVAWSGTISQLQDAHEKRNEFQRILNQQFIDARLAAETDVRTPVAKAPDVPLAAAVASVAAEALGDRMPRTRVDKESDEDEDKDDKEPPTPAAAPTTATTTADADAPDGFRLELKEYPPLKVIEETDANDGKIDALTILKAAGVTHNPPQ
jgi:hypothetical protein